MRILYTLGIHLYGLGLRLAALCGHEKARLMTRTPAAPCAAAADDARPVAWFHAASLGEFEQARPVLERWRQRHADGRVVLTFFSPSGYEVRKNYPLADAVLYLPMDTPRNVRHFLDTYRPTVAFFVKYEFWYNYLDGLRRRGIPTYLFSAIFRPRQYFFGWYGRWFRRQLRVCFTHIFVQNAESLRLLQGAGVSRCSVAGDTRFDRVQQIAAAAERDEAVERWLVAAGGGPVVVAGSTWPPDEALLQKVVTTRLILAPHVISEEHLRHIETLFPDCTRYSALPSQPLASATASTLIIDNIGMLSRLYRYADVAYIGGGFGVGIHNILEAVTFGKPVMFGPNHSKFQEARDIIACGGGWSVDGDPATMGALLQRLLSDHEAYSQASQACLDYMRHNLGSTETILNTVER